MVNKHETVQKQMKQTQFWRRVYDIISFTLYITLSCNIYCNINKNTTDTMV